VTATEKARGASFVLQHLSPKCGVSLQHCAHIANPVYETCGPICRIRPPHGWRRWVVGIEGGVVSGVFNLESSGVRASDWRPRHDTKPDSSQPAAETAVYLFDDWFDPIEAGVRNRVREFIQAMASWMRHRCARGTAGVPSRRAAMPTRRLVSPATGMAIVPEIAVPQARLDGPELPEQPRPPGTTTWRSGLVTVSCQHASGPR
jgi:hypothetical protein